MSDEKTNLVTSSMSFIGAGEGDEPGGWYCGGQVLHGAVDVVHKQWIWEQKKIKLKKSLMSFIEC